MIELWCKRPSISLRLLAKELRKLGVEVKLWTSSDPLKEMVAWGKGGGDKYEELVRLSNAGIPVPRHSRTKKPGWLARTTHHKEARDLLRELTIGDYYVEYIPTIREHRVHVVGQRIIRIQGKVPRIENPHPKFRSWRSGWRLEANPKHTEMLPPQSRELAKKAIKAMGYEFGAVDIGTRNDGSAIVWEVNSQPGIEGGTVRCYARAFKQEFDR